MNPLRCPKCLRVIDERTGEVLHPETVEAPAGWTCPGCAAKSNAETLARWRALSADEKCGTRTSAEVAKEGE